ncbi:E3 ubiquitin-protein ligase Mdm2-like [Hydractinia symbiolongicarpus]|uniref:E3 ubiquitin-protein ligase Mdm2-like n=1 Tax=Hydractinia symbiolongicarpus TaxID=13093 RepID=UPI002550A0C0|nr:E3 ubiquitin-protein ligase Mdm2-like [Hydractinia symbiolongicarpus]
MSSGIVLDLIHSREYIDDFDLFTVPDLRARARYLGLRGYSRLRRAELIELLLSTVPARYPDMTLPLVIGMLDLEVTEFSGPVMRPNVSVPRPVPAPIRPVPARVEVDDEDDADDDIDEDNRCIICLSKRKTATIVHGRTGHFCCCLSCANKLENRGDKCPICRASIDLVIRQNI